MVYQSNVLLPRFSDNNFIIDFSYNAVLWFQNQENYHKNTTRLMVEQ